MRITESSGAAFTIVELLVALAVGSVILTGTICFALYSCRSYSALSNYLVMDQQGQLALDKFTQQVRQVNGLVSYTSTNSIINSVTFQDFDGVNLVFGYDPSRKFLYRAKGGVTNILLTGCDSLQFTVYQRTPQSNTFDAVTTAVATNCKLVQVSWMTSRKILGVKANTMSVQSSKVTIRAN